MDDLARATQTSRPRRARLGTGKLAARIDFHVFCQYLFFDQWSALRARANAVGIAIMGDIPIFVAHDSADVWANPHLFKLDAAGLPTVVAGVPPDYFSATGQLWGNPLYDWQAMQAADYTWWVARFRHLLELVDLVRVDHFRGFEAAWEVPATAETAINGAWITGPGKDVFEAINRALGERVPIIAEDLGLITDEVRDLLAHTRFPGMKVLQFAFGGGTDNLYLPHNFPSPNCVVYTGAHDNDTTRGWFAQAPDHERAFVTRSDVGAPHARRDDITYDLIRLALSSIANTAIVPLQDVLNLDTEARMNTPGATGSSWMWRIQADQLDPACADRLAELTTLYGRACAAPPDPNQRTCSASEVVVPQPIADLRQVARDPAAGEVAAQVLQVAEQQGVGVGVEAWVDCLREIDDFRFAGVPQHVVGRQVAVDDVAAQPELDVVQQTIEGLASLVGLELDILEHGSWSVLRRR